MEESINKFLDYCEKTGKRPEKVSIDGKGYIIEWHPNKMLKRIYPKPLSMEEVEIFYASKKLLRQGTSSCDVRKMLCDHKRDFELWKRK